MERKSVYNLTAPPKWEYVRRNPDKSTIPPAEADVYLWSNDKPLPTVGDRILNLVNGFGMCEVAGYFTESIYVGIYAIPDVAPAWWVEQNKRNKRDVAATMVFGSEIVIDKRE